VIKKDIPKLSIEVDVNNDDTIRIK